MINSYIFDIYLILCSLYWNDKDKSPYKNIIEKVYFVIYTNQLLKLRLMALVKRLINVYIQ